MLNIQQRLYQSVKTNF